MLEFTWQSFAFAVVNFLILAGLLYRLLSKPLLNVLAKRSQELEATRKAAEGELAKAQELEAEFNAKMRTAEDESHRLTSEARARAEATGREVMETARAEAEQEAQRLKQAFDQERREALADLRQDIVGAAVGIAQRVVAQAGGEDLDRRLNAQLSEKLETLGADGAVGAGDSGVPVRVVSASELDPAARQSLEERIKALTGAETQVRFATDADLVAGSRVEFETVTVDATVADALAGIETGATGDGDGQQRTEQ